MVSKVKVDVEIYSYTSNKSRKIAYLPSPSDELVELLKKEYPRPRYWVRLLTTFL